jgi:hypothetical protein
MAEKGVITVNQLAKRALELDHFYGLFARKMST